MKISACLFKKISLSIKGKKPGFTLVEVLLSTAILTFILAGLYAVFNVGNLSYGTDTKLLDLQQDARLAMDWMVREIRQAFPATLTPFPLVNSNTINFDTFLTDNITYSHNINTKQIIRNEPLDPIPARVIANNIEVLNLNYLPARRILEIEIEVEHPQRPDLSFSLTEQVRLRNE